MVDVAYYGPKEGANGAADGFVQPCDVYKRLSSQLGHFKGLEAGKEGSTHERAADPGARGGWMST